MQFNKVNYCKGQIDIPGDKSISHRSIMFGSLAKGKTEIHHFLEGADCLSTIQCFRQLGISIERHPDCISIDGKGLHGLQKPNEILDCGNSGTTTRLISGILSAQQFDTTITGDASIQSRPMKRIITPLTLMGANITSLKGNDCAPLMIKGSNIHGITYESPIASAQVKSAVLLAGLYADSETRVSEPALSRNHSEIMLKGFGVDIRSEKNQAILMPNQELFGQSITVPGDISSAAFFIAAGLLIPNSEILLKNVGINPTRDGIIKVAKAMGGNIEMINPHLEGGELCSDLLIRSSKLHGTIVSGDIIPTLIDEIPIIAIMAAFAEGETVIKDAAELKVKESNRIDIMVQNLKHMGASIEGTDDGMIIQGQNTLQGASIVSKSDHRIAMSFAIAGLLSEGTTQIDDFDCVAISYPNFLEHIKTLTN